MKEGGGNKEWNKEVKVFEEKEGWMGHGDGAGCFKSLEPNDWPDCALPDVTTCSMTRGFVWFLTPVIRVFVPFTVPFACLL